MAKQPTKEENGTKLSRTISNGTGRPHTHVNKGGGHVKKSVLIPTFSIETLDNSIKTQICDLFINQMVKVALASLTDKNTENSSN